MAEKKQIICPKCKAKLKFDLDKITSEVVKFKCPGCGSVLRIRKPGSPKEPISDAAAGQEEVTITKPESGSETEQASMSEPAAPEKIDEEASTSQESLSEEKYGTQIPEDSPDLPEEPGESAAWDPSYDDLNELESRSEAEQASMSEPAAPEKIEEEVPAAQETLPEENRVVCQNCKAMLKFDPDRITTEVVKAKCPGCGSLLVIRKPGAPIEPSPPTTDASKSESGVAAEPDTESPRVDSKKEEYGEDLGALGQTDQLREPVSSAAWVETDEKPPAAQETLSEENRVVCRNCKAMLKFDPDRITTEVVKAKCPGCGSVLVIRKPGAPIEPSPPSTEQAGEPVPSAVSEKTEVGTPAAQEPQPGITHGPQIPEDQLVGPEEEARDSILEDFDSEKLRGYEEGEAEEGDYEWTQYAEQKGPKLPESQIDLDVIPATADALQDTLADLQQAEMYNFQGENHLEKNRVPQAIRDFNHALEINPDYVDALVNRGSAYVLQNEFNAALNDFNHALELETREAEIYNIRGEIYLLNRMYNEAIRDFTAAIILNPVYSDAYLNRAKAYNEKGMAEEAEIDFNQAIRADSDKFVDYADLTSSESLFDDKSASIKEKAAEHMHQGLVELKDDNFYEAVENFTKVINLEPDNAPAYINRAQAYVELGQTDEAMVDLNRAVIYDPLNSALYYWRAMAWKAMDSPINMVADLKLSCELGYKPACEEYEKCKPRKH